jgi:hypothetical protein
VRQAADGVRVRVVGVDIAEAVELLLGVGGAGAGDPTVEQVLGRLCTDRR